MIDKIVSYEVAKLAKEAGFDIAVPFIYNKSEINVYDTSEILFRYTEGISDYAVSLSEDIFNYCSNSNMRLTGSYDNKTKLNFICTAPTQSLLQRWLREVHNIDISIITNYKNSQPIETKTYRCGIIYIEGNLIESFFIRPVGDKFSFVEFKTYELALEEALKESLKLIK